MFSMEWVMALVYAIPAVFILYALIKYFGSGGAAVPYPQAADNFQKELARLNNTNLTTIQREQSIDRLSSRPVRVDGVVNDVKPKYGNYGTATDIYLVVDVDGFGAVTCDLADQDSITRASSLNKGQKVRVKGRINEHSFPNPLLFEAKLA